MQSVVRLFQTYLMKWATQASPIQLVIYAIAIGATCPAFAADENPFNEYIRKTEPLTAEQQQKLFHLPPGFEIQLVASDPDIRKPMNLAFDARGRLWVTETGLYPMPAKDEASKKDSIKILEDTNGDGKADKITVFADKLDIPVGLLPLGDGSKCIAYDINNTTLYTDTDGDGGADTREVLYSGWGFKDDTHGMSSNYRRGFDGWVYGCHGFNNTSDVKGKDGQVLHLKSGNTYRFKVDGSHIEAWTIGQINPFGFCFDRLGNQYSSDSHSKPNYQLLRGGRYEAFDRNTDDGLGLAPAMMSHLHGSTAIAGIVQYDADQFPEEFRGDNFVGNVMTCRLNRDKLEYRGSSPQAIEQPDFLSTDDPWFRPVNTILGPDGALYVADFYNRIVAHYEVKLDDPRRDLERGRIWRIIYTGDEPHADATMPQPALAKQTVDQLIVSLAHANLTVRMMATDELTDRIGNDAIEPLKRAVGAKDAASTTKTHGL
ncbi:MAG: hypothetical protein H0T11_03100, partial [Chthoniobacterales bacterium]|nr:hypothetical protein [Chthoniobacterales bacterium]